MDSEYKMLTAPVFDLKRPDVGINIPQCLLYNFREQADSRYASLENFFRDCSEMEIDDIFNLRVIGIADPSQSVRDIIRENRGRLGFPAAEGDIGKRVEIVLDYFDSYEEHMVNGRPNAHGTALFLAGAISSMRPVSEIFARRFLDSCVRTQDARDSQLVAAFDVYRSEKGQNPQVNFRNMGYVVGSVDLKVLYQDDTRFGESVLTFEDVGAYLVHAQSIMSREAKLAFFSTALSWDKEKNSQ